MNKYYDHNWKKDWVGEWFPILRSLGEFTDIVYIRCKKNSHKVFFLDHGRYDGIGGFKTLLFQEKIMDASHRSNVERRPSFFKRVIGFLKYVFQANVRHVDWKQIQHSLPGKKQDPLLHSFSVSETSQLLGQCKKLQSTLTAFILKQLDSCVRKLMQMPAQAEKKENLWLIPVDMRGDVTRKHANSNHASYISVIAGPEDDPSKLGQKLKRSLEIGHQWAAWWGILLGRYVGLKGMDRILRNYHDKQHSWAGTLSNLGVWNCGTSDECWGFCPPVSKSHPVALGLLTWNGQLTLALQIHPCLVMSEQATQILLDELVKRLRQESMI